MSSMSSTGHTHRQAGRQEDTGTRTRAHAHREGMGRGAGGGEKERDTVGRGSEAGRKRAYQRRLRPDLPEKTC